MRVAFSIISSIAFIDFYFLVLVIFFIFIVDRFCGSQAECRKKQSNADLHGSNDVANE